MDTSRSKFVEGRLSLRTLMIMRMLFGFYCNISCNRILSFLARLYCICLANAVTITIIIGCIKYEVGDLLLMCMCLEYNLNGLVSIFTGEQHVINFYKEIEGTDREMGLEHLPLLTFRCKVLFLVYCGYKTVLNVQLFLLFRHHGLILWSSFVIGYALYISNVSRCFPLEILRLRIKHLWYDLEAELKRENWSQNNKISSVLETLKLYRHLTNNLMISSWEKFLICVSLTFTFYGVLIHVRNVISGLKYGTLHDSYGKFITVDLILTCIINCLPAILIEMVAREVEALRLVIANALLFEDDDDLHAALAGATEYLALRPFRATVCRAFALDASLVLSFVNLVTTYIILVIQ